MPEINFVLPHWLFWGGLILFPATAFLIFRRQLQYRQPDKKSTGPVSLPLAYFLLVVGGFVGVHRLYLKSVWALVFIFLFSGIQAVNIQVRDARDQLSSVNNEIRLADFRMERADKAVEEGRKGAAEKREKIRHRLDEARLKLVAAEADSSFWNTLSMILGLAVLSLLAIDAYLLPRLVRQRNSIESDETYTGFQCPSVESEYNPELEPFAFSRAVSRINGIAGELVAYWSVIAVFVYYYEVIVRYVFNSPTNWAHESMFLMFGMQYLLAGGYVLREGAHVRVDVIYTNFSKRTKAIVDIVTSLFFFIFMITLLVTGFIFFNDSLEVNEVSFTEWGVHYWPIKFAIPLGAVLLLMQGVAQLAKDIAVLQGDTETDLHAETRPEG